VTPKRPRDPNQLAKSIIDIATGQKPDRDPTPEEQGKDPAAVAMGKKVGAARATVASVVIAAAGEGGQCAIEAWLRPAGNRLSARR
jgi:hypothetical protein